MCERRAKRTLGETSGVRQHAVSLPDAPGLVTCCSPSDAPEEGPAIDDTPEVLPRLLKFGSYNEMYGANISGSNASNRASEVAGPSTSAGPTHDEDS